MINPGLHSCLICHSHRFSEVDIYILVLVVKNHFTILHDGGCAVAFKTWGGHV